MAKVGGLGEIITVMDATSSLQTITNDITNWSFTNPRNTEDVTGIDKFANEIILLLADFTLTLNGIFNTAANMSHAVFATVTSTSVIRQVNIFPIGGTTPKMSVNNWLTDYQITRDNTGDLTWQVPGQLADGNVPTWA